MAKWVDRTGDVYGALRVIGPIRQAVMRQMLRHAIEHHARKQFAEEQRAADRTESDP